MNAVYLNVVFIAAKRKLLVQAKRGFTVSGWAEHVTALMDKIYVSQMRSILVYKNQAPYPQLQVLRFPPTMVGNSLPIRVSEMHRCLYAPDQNSQCIYKIEPMLEHRMTTWLNEAGSLSVAVSCSGDVLVLDRKITDTSLRVFSHDGVLKSNIPVSSSFDESVESVEEIMSNIVALAYRKVDTLKPSGTSGFILVRRLDETETVLRKIIWEAPLKCFVPFPCWQLLVGEQGSKHCVITTCVRISLKFRFSESRIPLTCVCHQIVNS